MPSLEEAHRPGGTDKGDMNTHMDTEKERISHGGDGFKSIPPHPFWETLPLQILSRLKD